ncbi:hypothetical protein SDC9_94268 [bioreactor metagenome]|uniref:Uncharacterized protein n=1 Tax=bioreactor metagenome TaxID=1076179 RepID=A0A645A3A2_9ZZZZ
MNHSLYPQDNRTHLSGDVHSEGFVEWVWALVVKESDLY